jgi:hypothetical protein
MLKIAPRKEKVISQLKQIDHLLLANQIPYCAVGGTLLGCIRHRGFIPWDDDFDLLLKDTDIDLCVTKKLFESIGFNCILVGGPPEYIDMTLDDKIEIGGTLCIEKDGVTSHLFPYKIIGESILTNVGPYDFSVTFPFRRFMFENFFIFVPNDPKHYLDKSSPNWMTEKIIRYDKHIDERIEEYKWSVPEPIEILNVEGNTSFATPHRSSI